MANTQGRLILRHSRRDCRAATQPHRL